MVRLFYMVMLMSLNFIEVCAGGGGLSSGLIQAGLSPLLLNDDDKWCCETLKKNHPRATVFKGSFVDIKTKDYAGKVDVLAGGVPCQAFSQAGLREGFNDPRGNLFLEFLEMINKIQPKCFLVENVKGLLTQDGGKSFKNILQTIENIGTYNVKYKVLNAWDHGVAQKRERLFIVGVRKDIVGVFNFPTPQTHKPVLREVLIDVPGGVGQTYPEHKKEIMRRIPAGGCWTSLPEDLQRRYLGGSFTSGGGKRGMARRLSMDEPSLTLTTSPAQKQTERCHPVETRPLTVREYARIQSFPDEYIFEGSMNQQYKQIGNAVPVKLAWELGKCIKNVLT